MGLIDTNDLLARIRLNYNNHQTIGIAELKDILTTTPSCHNIEKIYASLDATEKDALYRKLWSDYVRSDVETNIAYEGKELNEAGIENVVNRYVYQGDYDCEPYWDDINRLVNEAYEKEEYRKDSKEPEME